MNEIPHLVPISVFSFAKIQLYTVFSKFCPIKLFNMTKNFIGSGQPYNVPRVSINPLIAFVTATERRKKTIGISRPTIQACSKSSNLHLIDSNTG